MNKQGYQIKVKTKRALHPLTGYLFTDKSQAISVRDNLRDAVKAAWLNKHIDVPLELKIIFEEN